MVQIVIEAGLPALIIGIPLAFLAAVAARHSGHRIALWASNRRTLATQRRHAVEHSAARARAVAAARDAIAATITELDSRPATYATFPPDIRDLLHDAHTQSALLEPGDSL